MFFCINATPEWLDGFDSYGSDEPLEETFDALGARFTAFTKLLEEKPKVIFRLSLPQTGKFNEFFTAEKDRMQELNGDRYSASTHRLAWCFLRIAMVLTTLRRMDSGTIKESVECSDADFDMTISQISSSATSPESRYEAILRNWLKTACFHLSGMAKCAHIH